MMPWHSAFALVALLPAVAWAAGDGMLGENLLWLAIILMAARLFAPLAEKIGFPAVLGELPLGVALGNLSLFGIQYFDTIARDPIIAFMAELGVIVIMVILTTPIAPPVLTLLPRKDPRAGVGREN